jgi:hypothetical protein
MANSNGAARRGAANANNASKTGTMKSEKPTAKKCAEILKSP